MADKKLKAKFLQIVAEYQNESWVKYFKSKIDNVVQLENGELVGIEKHSIETHFCFDDSYDYEGAGRMAEIASKDEEYFRRANIEPAQREIDKLKSRHELYEMGNWIDRYNGKIRVVVAGVPGNYKTEMFAMSEADRQTYIKGCEEELEHFKKRIDTYLKRYGMSKVETWTYWGEA